MSRTGPGAGKPRKIRQGPMHRLGIYLYLFGLGRARVYKNPVWGIGVDKWIYWPSWIRSAVSRYQEVGFGRETYEILI